MLLYIVRHGETDWNTQKRLQGQADTQLNANGIRLAGITAQGMKDIPLDLGITSPLQRAKKTAEIILEGRNVPLLEDDRLKEISFGSWEGLCCSRSHFEIPTKHFDDFYLRPFDFVPAADGETVGMLCKRLESFWQDLIHTPEYQDKSILIASHGCAVRALLHQVYEDKEDFWRGHVPMNCSVNIVEVKDGQARIVEEDKVYYSKEDCVDFYAAES